MAKKKIEKTPTVAILWTNDGESVYTLAYNNGRGATRLYDRDNYDSRCDEDLPFFDSYDATVGWLAANVGKQCQVEVSVVRQFGL